MAKKGLIYISCILVLAFSMASALAQNKFSFGVTGVKNKSAEKNIIAQLTAQQKSLPTLTKKNKSQLIFRMQAAVKNALKPYGYFYAKSTINFTKIKNTWQANITVQPGPVLYFSKVSIKIKGPGGNLKLFQALLNHPPIKPGQVFNIEKYEKLKQQLFEIAQTHGYLKALMTKHKIKIDLKNKTCKVVLHFHTGKQYYFGKVKFQKNPLNTKFLNRYINFKSGQPYTPDGLLTLQENLNNSGYFSEVNVRPQEWAMHHNIIPVYVHLKPADSKQYVYGLGYGTDTGPRGSVGFNWLRTNQWGHKLTTSLSVSAIQQVLQATYNIPGKNPLTDHYTIGTSVLNSSTGTGSNSGASQLAQLSFGYLTKHNGWQRTTSLTLAQERYKLKDGVNVQTARLVMPGISWLKSKADDLLFTNKGYRIGITLKSASSALLSTTSFLQGQLNTKYIFSPTNNSRVILRSDLGATLTKNNNKLPLSVQFFAGGAQSIRGFAYQELGPGKYLAVGSAEYQHRIRGKWYGTVFYDAGNASNNLHAKILSSPGVGLMYASPMGPVELTVAKRMDLAGLKAYRIAFTIGPDL